MALIVSSPGSKQMWDTISLRWCFSSAWPPGVVTSRKMLRGGKFHWVWVLSVRCTLHLVYCAIATKQPQNTPLLLSPWHNKLATTSWFWRSFRPTRANHRITANRARPALSVDVWQLARVGWNGRQKALPRAVGQDRRAPPLSLVDNIKFISLKILVILMRSSTILLIYTRSGLPAILKAIVAIFWPQRCAT